MFIQDALIDSLAREVPQGGRMTVYADVVYFGARAPGIVVNEFTTQPAADPQKPPVLHSGADLGATAAGKK